MRIDLILLLSGQVLSRRKEINRQWNLGFHDFLRHIGGDVRV